MGTDRKRIIVHGTGGTAKFYVEMDLDPEKFELIGFSDGNSKMWGTNFLGKNVYSPQQLSEIAFDDIIIASVFYEEIRDNLIASGISEEKIHTRFYGQLEGIQKRYEDFYDKKAKKKKSKNHVTVHDGERIAIYTAIAGGYDTLKEPEYINPECDYICFTDNPRMVSDTWQFRPLPIVNGDYNRTAKQVKVLIHQFLPDYDWSIWVDGKFAITGNLIQLLNEYAVNSNFLSFMHYRRNSVFADADVIKRAGFELESLVDSQMNRYCAEGFTDDNELLEGGILFRRHNAPEIIQLMETWWNEITKYSKRDQLSFNYCAWKEKVFCDMIDMNIYDNHYVKAYPHTRKKVKA